MAQEQPSAVPWGEPTSVGALITSDLAPLVLKNLLDDSNDVRMFRLVCKESRNVVDSELVTALRLRGAEAAGVDAATQLRLACGMLARGSCRRLQELALTLPDGVVPHAAKRLLSSVPRSPGLHRPAITKLTISLQLLIPEVARAAGAALPGLGELFVLCDGIDGRVDSSIDWRSSALQLAKQQQAALGLGVLLGPSSTPDIDTAGEAGTSAARGAQAPLLPVLRRLELGPNLDGLPLALAAPLRAATQLRFLRLHLDLSHSSAAASLSHLSGMTQLDTLEFESRNAHRQPEPSFPDPQYSLQQYSSCGIALAPLGGSLRSLAISFERSDRIQPQLYTALRSLQELRLGDGMVLASSLAVLTSLTRLDVGVIALASDEIQARTRFRLPPRLQALQQSRCSSVEVLAALEPLPCLTDVSAGPDVCPGYSGDGVVHMGLAFSTSRGADGRLLPAGEEALCRTAALLSGAHTLHFWGTKLLASSSDPLLLPPSEPAPGFEGHGGWLSAWGANGLKALVLMDVALITPDLATIARRMILLERLVLVRCSFPFEAVWELAALPRLTELVLRWHQGTQLPDGLEEALRGLRKRAGPRLKTHIIFQMRPQAP